MHAGDRNFTNNTSEQGLKKSIGHHDLPFLFSKLSLLTKITKNIFLNKKYILVLDKPLSLSFFSVKSSPN